MVDPVPSHYQRLGVTPAASTEEIRTAYRALVGRFHPDRLQGASVADRALAERRMREVNEAWRILRDPTSRRAYDESRRPGARPTPRSTRPTGRPESAEVTQPGPSELDDDLVDVLPPMTGLQAGLFRHLPWVLLVVVLGGIFVLTAYAGGGDDAPADDRARAATVGECLDLPGGTATTIVACRGPHDARIVARVSSVTECPVGTEGRRLAADGLFDCLAPT